MTKTEAQNLYIETMSKINENKQTDLDYVNSQQGLDKFSWLVKNAVTRALERRLDHAEITFNTLTDLLMPSKAFTDEEQYVLISALANKLGYTSHNYLQSPRRIELPLN